MGCNKNKVKKNAFSATLIILIASQLFGPQLVRSQEDRFQKDISPKNVQRLEIAIQLRKSGDFAKAIERLKSLIQDEPNFYRAHYNLALAYVFKKDYDEAIKSFTKALEIRKHNNIADTTIYNSIGRTYFFKGNYGKSKEYFKIAMKKENQDLLTIESKSTSPKISETQKETGLESKKKMTKEEREDKELKKKISINVFAIVVALLAALLWPPIRSLLIKLQLRIKYGLTQDSKQVLESLWDPNLPRRASRIAKELNVDANRVDTALAQLSDKRLVRIEQKASGKFWKTTLNGQNYLSQLSSSRKMW